jgi:hypothetical protein
VAQAQGPLGVPPCEACESGERGVQGQEPGGAGGCQIEREDERVRGALERPHARDQAEVPERCGERAVDQSRHEEESEHDGDGTQEYISLIRAES